MIARVRARAGHPGLVTISVMLATIMQVLDMTIANVALPHMQGSLSATQDQIAWVLTSYIVATAVMTPPTGYLAGRYGIRSVLIVAVAGFTLSSIFCGAATSLQELVAFRILQGACGASLVPLSQAVLLNTYPREQHGQAMALWGVGVMVAPILGPTIGGHITEYYSWRWVFYLNVPVGILALLGISSFLPASSLDRDRPFDWLGFSLLSVCLGALQLCLDRGETLDWFSSHEILAEAVIAGLCLYLFVVHTATSRHPFITPAIFRDRNFDTGLFFVFIMGVTIFATMTLLPPFLQNLVGYPAIATGYLLAPRGIGTMMSMLTVGRLINRVDPRRLIAFGLAVSAFSLWRMSNFNLDVDSWTLVWTGFIQGIGIAFLFIPVTTLSMATLEPRLRTEAATVFSLMRNIGSSIGIAAVFALYSRNVQINHAALAEFASPYRAAMKLPGVATYWNLDQAAGLTALNTEITRQAAAIAYLNDFRLIMVMSLLAIPFLLLTRAPARAAPAGGPVITE